MDKEYLVYMAGAGIFLGGLAIMPALKERRDNAIFEKERWEMFVESSRPVRRETFISEVDSNGLPLQVNINWYDSKSNLVKYTHYHLPSEKGNNLVKEILK